MTTPRSILSLALLFGVTLVANAQQENDWIVKALDKNGWAEFDLNTGLASGTNGVLVIYKDAVLTADQVSVNQITGEAIADGHVHIQRDDQVWVGEHIRYNFKTRQMEAEQFRTGRPPVFAHGGRVEGGESNGTYTAHDAYITTDDSGEPRMKVRASSITITPGQRITAR